jgi:4-carboxymuconolactone decarboxylase
MIVSVTNPMKLQTYLLILLAFTVVTMQAHSQTTKIMQKNLSPKQTSLITIASYTAQGELEKLKPALSNGLEAGLTVNEIKESLMHAYAYCGFPRSLRGIMTFMEVLKERKAKGITDKEGPAASQIKDDRSKYVRGKETLAELTGVKEAGPATGYAAFVPEIEVFLKEHLFADLFERDVLSYQDRELVTVAVIASIGKADPMLQSHLGICLNVGITPSQLQEFLAVIKTTVRNEDAVAAEKVLSKVLEKK